MMTVSHNTPISYLTVGQLIEVLDKHFNKPVEQKDFTSKVYVYGLKGIAEALGVSKITACKLNRSGVLDDAIIQKGRTIIADKEKLIEAYSKI